MKKIAIIGSGIAGLSAGCYASMNGYEAHIYEMHDQPGGLCTAWKRKGYTFDVCIHWLTGSDPSSSYNKIWQELGVLRDKKIYYKEMGMNVILKEGTVRFYSDPDKLAREFKKISPEDSEHIDVIADAMKKMYMMNRSGLPKPKELCNLFDNMLMMFSFLPILGFVKKMSITIKEFADRFQSPLLKKALLAISDMYTHDSLFILPFMLATGDSGFPEGGSYDFAKTIEKRFTDLGGKIHYKSEIKKILVNENKAVGLLLEDGSEVKADIVISAADGYSTLYNMLDGKYVNDNLKRIYNEELLTPAWLQISLGVDMDLSKEENTKSIYNIYELDEPIIIEGKENKNLTLKNYGFDPTFAPKGKTTLVVGFSCDDFAYWKKLYEDKNKYKKEKKNIEKTIIANLEKIYPGIKNKIETVDVSTPMTIYRYTHNREGSIMGFINPFQLNLPRTFKDFQNFYMVGHWVGGSGLPGASQSGREILEVICRRDKKKFITTTPK